ncbi:MAG: TIGR03936 family radical SAM-associated protein [Clostridium sp.]|nr:TIGR03936 family radical SAM-associated protein [Clostridium sp.]
MKIRVKFSKYGALRFIGHLDVMRYFQKAIRRAEIDIAYSEGFSPHQIMSFASPLSVGHTSEGEYFDMEVNSFTGEEDLLKRLQAAMVEGIDILKVKLLPEKEKNAMASVAAADYLVTFSEKVNLPDDWRKQLLDFYGQRTIPVIKKTKKGQRELDLKEGVYRLEPRDMGVYMLVDAGSGSNVKPGFVLETFFEQAGILLPEYPFHIHRIDTYKRLESGKLSPLL